MITGFNLSDDASVLTAGPVYDTAATQSSDVGDYAISASGAAATNYVFDYVGGTLTIDPATLTVIPDDKAREVGEANPLLTGTINGFKLGQDATVLTSQPVYMTDAELESPDGRYAITASGAAADNYVFAYETGTLTVGDPVDIPTSDGGANAISLLLESLKVCGSGVGPLDEVLCNPVFEQAPPPLVLGLVNPTGQPL